MARTMTAQRTIAPRHPIEPKLGDIHPRMESNMKGLRFDAMGREGMIA